LDFEEEEVLVGERFVGDGLATLLCEVKVSIAESVSGLLHKNMGL